MGSKDRVFDDLSRMAGGAVGIVSGMGQSLREEISSRIDEAVQRLDLVPREDFERLEAVVQAQAERLETLEKPLSKSKKTPKKKS